MDRSKHCGQPTKSSFIGPMYQIRATNEIAYADQAGELQFLRRSLLAALLSSVRDTLRFCQRNCFNISGHTLITSAGLYVSGMDSQTSTSTG